MRDAPRPTRAPFLRFSPNTGWPQHTPVRQGIPQTSGPLRLGAGAASALPVTEPFGSFGGAVLPRGLAIGADGHLFLADPDAQVVRGAPAADCVAGAAPFAPLWPHRPDTTDAYHLSAPSDVATTPRGDLVIADPGAGKVLVLDWPSARIRADLRQPGWQPQAVAVLPCGGLLVADPAGRCVHRYDPQFRLVAGWMHPDVTLEAPSALAVVADPQGPRAPIALMLDRGQVVALDAAGRATDVPHGTLTPPALQRAGAGFVFADPRWPGRAALKIPHLQIARDGRLAGTSLPILAVPRRIQVPLSGKIIFGPLDSQIRAFAWDRITCQLDLPASSRLLLRTLTTEAPIAADQIPLQPETAWSSPLEIAAGDLAEGLIQSGKGRYLWIWLDLFSDGRSSPQIHRIDVHGPRQSGLTHLPAPFHSDPQSRDFLDRFLSYFDTIFAELRHTSDDMPRYFDPYAVPEGQWLDWLGRWFDLSFLAQWDVQTRREMVAHAIASARERGTRAGLARHLRWHLGLGAPWPGIIEHFCLGATPPPIGHVPLPSGGAAHRVTIVLPRAAVPPADEARLRRLIDTWLPAHVGYDLRFIRPGFVLGRQSTPGLDAYLGAGQAQPLGAGRAGIDLALPSAARGDLHLTQTNSSQSIGDCHGR